MASYTVRESGKSGAHRVFNWPLEMFEELATNCILHKEYSRKQYIGIYVYRDHLSFINHNRPVPPVTIEDLNTKVVFDDRHYLNDELKEMFFKLDLIQSYGSGVRRSISFLRQNARAQKARKMGLLELSASFPYINFALLISQMYVFF